MSYDPEVVGKVLRDATEILKTEGWIQRQLASDDGLCAIGAIRRAGAMPMPGWSLHWSPLSIAAARAFEDWLKGIDPSLQSYVIPNWNDAPGRTKEEVIQHLFKCADELDPEHAAP